MMSFRPDASIRLRRVSIMPLYPSSPAMRESAGLDISSTSKTLTIGCLNIKVVPINRYMDVVIIEGPRL